MKKRAGKDRKSHLDDDEAALWEHTARSISPLKKPRGRVHHATEGADDVPPRPKTTRLVAEKKAEKPAAKADAEVQKKSIPPIAEFDRIKARRLRTGKAEIEARIDLHGMRQDEAHAALRAFLRRAQSRDFRLVLVITGKGAKGQEDRHEPFDMSRERNRGILKRNVPYWLEEADLRGIVVSYTPASIAHGGDGALYVQLRRRRL